MKNALLLALLTLPLAADANDLCVPVSKIQFSECKDNGLVAIASERCLDNVYTLSNLVASSLSWKNARALASNEKKKSQKREFELQSFGLKENQLSLDLLLAETKKARERVDVYLAMLLPPAEAYSDELSLDASHKYASDVPCFMDPLLTIEDHYDELGRMIADIERAKKESTRLKKLTDASTTDLNAGTRTVKGKTVRAPSAQGAVRKDSNISETTRKQK